MSRCPCGCGLPVKPGNRYAAGGHNQKGLVNKKKAKLPGWPKRLACPGCGLLRLAESPAHRMHDACRKRAADGIEAVGFLLP